jgi:hypothetical protein
MMDVDILSWMDTDRESWTIATVATSHFLTLDQLFCRLVRSIISIHKSVCNQPLVREHSLMCPTNRENDPTADNDVNGRDLGTKGTGKFTRGDDYNSSRKSLKPLTKNVRDDSYP